MSRSLSRRQLVSNGAAAGAALLGGAVLASPVAAAGSSSGDGDGFGADSAVGSLPAAALAPAATTSQELMMGFFEFELTATSAGAGPSASVNYAALPSRRRGNPAQNLFARPLLPPGTTIDAVDVFGWATGATTQQWSLIVVDLAAGDVTVGTASLTATATGEMSGTLLPAAGPFTLASRQWVSIGVATSSSAWVRGAIVHYRLSAPAFVPVSPQRVYDSRIAGAKLVDGEERAISVADAIDGGPVVPAGATAVAVTLTVTLTEGAGGYVAAFPAGAPWPGTSSVNWFGPDQNLATATIVALGGDRQLTLRGGVAATHVIVDVTGYVG